MRPLAIVAAMAVATSLSACATITRGTHTAWEVTTNPPGAQVVTSNSMQCSSTPCSLRIARDAEFDAKITKDGYKPVSVHVTHQISAGGGVGMAGNVLLGGIIGAGVDATSGAMDDLTPNPVNLSLEKNDAIAGTVTPTPAIAPAPAPVAPVEKPAT